MALIVTQAFHSCLASSCSPKSAMGFQVGGFLVVESRFFDTVVFAPVVSTASLAFFYREPMFFRHYSGGEFWAEG